MLSRLQADVATALREGRLHVVPASELVPGDIVEVAGGLHLTCPRPCIFKLYCRALQQLLDSNLWIGRRVLF